MTSKPVVARELALNDIADASKYYLWGAGEATALAFAHALQRALGQIASHPGIGSPRYAHELRLMDLRSWPLRRFPYLVFFVERADRIDVWRLLHAQREVGGWLEDPDGHTA